MGDIDSNITFKQLEVADFNLLTSWLNNSVVNKWWVKKPMTFEEVEIKYIKYVKGEKPTEGYIFYHKDTPIGYIQTYLISDYPEYKEMLGIEEDAAGMDLFIGEELFLHKGLGCKVIKKFLDDVIFTSIDRCIIGPEKDNSAAIKAYEKAGFNHFKTVWNHDEEVYEYLMVINRKNESDIY